MINYYAVLEVRPGDEHETIHEAYKQLALKLHPDREGGDHDKFSAITFAWSVLKDSKRRKEHDAKLKMLTRQCGRCAGTGLSRKQGKGFTTATKVTCTQCKGTGQQNAL